jgi:hypothetical protein
MMQVILKENSEGNLCLFDTRSGEFFAGGCVRSEDAGKLMLDIANDIANKSTKSIIEIADSSVYGNNGYLDSMLARIYLSLNPDLRQENKEEIKLKKDKKTTLKESGSKRGRPKKS